MQGAIGWGWDEMAKRFKAMEDHALGADELRGAGGPLKVTPHAERSELAEATIAACARLGIKRREDLNRLDHEGIAYLSYTIRDGVRQSAAAAFLAPVRSRPNLTVLTGTRVVREIRSRGPDTIMPGGRSSRTSTRAAKPAPAAL